jgi:uncharacterized damage-inducible protein DinB
MRKPDIQTLVDYMYWINHRLLAAASDIGVEAFVRPTAVTTRDLRGTLVHELDVEWSWRFNLQGRPPEEFGPDAELGPGDYADVSALRDHWVRDEAEMRAWLDSLTDRDLERTVASVLTRDQRPLWQYVVHIVTHAAQQQADAATLLSLAGRSPGELGYLEYLRSLGNDARD